LLITYDVQEWIFCRNITISLCKIYINISFQHSHEHGSICYSISFKVSSRQLKSVQTHILVIFACRVNIQVMEYRYIG